MLLYVSATSGWFSPSALIWITRHFSNSSSAISFWPWLMYTRAMLLYVLATSTSSGPYALLLALTDMWCISSASAKEHDTVERKKPANWQSDASTVACRTGQSRACEAAAFTCLTYRFPTKYVTGRSKLNFDILALSVSRTPPSAVALEPPIKSSRTTSCVRACIDTPPRGLSTTRECLFSVLTWIHSSSWKRSCWMPSEWRNAIFFSRLIAPTEFLSPASASVMNVCDTTSKKKKG
mmetsp:Transcript_7680/g.17710  ORF Transcript_7680/g.17710 Transcript_7680/m.17710 type:complete len:237 (-) Transcript_7680:259-969(-)